MVAEREIPARQCTMTLQFDTLALSDGGETDRYEYTYLAQSLWRQSTSIESKLTFPGRVQGVI